MILSGAEADKNRCFEERIDVFDSVSYILHIRGETAGGGARHLPLMAGLLRDDCIDKGRAQCS